MPLLKRKAFEKSSASGYLRDDDEVFHCEITDEIFKDYEEYCERIILVNSMVWSCEMTGKNNLTYAEALESEKAARRSLRDFPMELRIPILYLGSKTKKSSFAEMSEDVFNYVRERFFVGETVEACLEGDSWQEAHILSITAQKQPPGSKVMLPASSYCYEVEQYQEDNPAGGKVGLAPHDRVRRRKGVYSREKNRLFLKQFVQQTDGIITIKKTTLEKYNISKVNFDQIFTGNPPEFSPSKKLLKSPPSKTPAKTGSATKPGSANKLNKSAKKGTPDKKGQQQSMDKFLKKTDKNESAPKPKPPSDPNAKKNAQELAAKMRRAEEQMRQRKEEEKAKKKAYLKEWQKVKEDQELEDHKIIPKGTPVDMEGIPHQHFGDFLSVLEFVHIHGETLKVKDTLHNGLDVETFRKALTLKEHSGVFSDLIQMFLTTIFQLQEDEAEDYNESGGIQESTDDEPVTEGMNKAVELATKASKWSQTYLGTPLSKLPLDPTTVSEVLRLHLLSSGAAPGGRCATWRYHQRGGYSSHDDAGLRLRLAHPDILRTMRTRHVHDLSLGDKFLVLQCLMNQIISYATVRDVIEEKQDEMRNTKQALRTLHINERRREAQLIASRQELKKEYGAKKAELKLAGDKARAHDEELKQALDNINKEGERLKAEYEKKVKELKVELFDYTSYVGSDRAYRRYWLNQHVAGLFVESGAESRGPCRDKLADALHSRERAGSDKENESAANSRGGSPKKPLTHINGLANKLNGLESGTTQAQELLLCTGDLPTCHVHGKDESRPYWWVYHTQEQIEGLIQSLNKRGLRENDLRQNLELDKDNILEYIQKCPLHLLNPAAKAPPPLPSTRMHKFQPSLNVPDDVSLSEALELSLRDHILELEEKIFHGCLGVLKVKDREAWRGTIMVRGYDKQADYLSWGPERRYRDDYHMPGGVTAVPTDNKTDVTAIPENKYRDPGHCLEPRLNGVKLELGTASPPLATVRGLAGALLQVEQAIHHKYIKRPLGLSDKERKEREAKNKPLDLDALERWEISLMECRSFSQIVLHLFTLDSSVTWSASILNASCRLCRRKTDPDNMLLCDGCNKGHHLYCLKPKLTKVPDGDWFCEQCRPKERTPRKRRKLWSEPKEDSSSKSEDSEGELDLGLCGACGSGGELAAVCRACAARYHAECVAAPPSRQAKRWICGACQAPGAQPRGSRSHRESYDSEDNTTLISLKKTRTRQSKEASPLVNGNTPTNNRRSRKSRDDINTSTNKKAKTPITNGIHEEKAVNGRKRGSKEVHLHTEALEQLLKEVLKHKDCWPFYDPVDTEMPWRPENLTVGEQIEVVEEERLRPRRLFGEDDVPDYLDVIETPMDFTTIKEKLSRGEYETDAELLDDAARVFHNCYTYNKDTHPVAKAGVRLEKYIQRRCADLSLPPLPESDLEAEAEAEAEADGQAPPKRPRLK